MRLRDGGDGARTRCRRVIAELRLPRGPIDVEGLRAAAEARHGRPIRLVRLDGQDLPCGLWARLPEQDLVFFAGGTSPGHQRHIVAHELGHILLHHDEAEEARTVTEAAARLLFSTIDPATVTRVLGRTCYDTAQEHEAELFATLLLARERGPVGAGGDGDQEGALRRLVAGMGDAGPGR